MNIQKLFLDDFESLYRILNKFKVSFDVIFLIKLEFWVTVGKIIIF